MLKKLNIALERQIREIQAERIMLESAKSYKNISWTSQILWFFNKKKAIELKFNGDFQLCLR